MSEYLIERSGYFYYFRRVPSQLAPYDSRQHIKISLKTKDRSVARKRAIVHNETVEKFWREIAASPTHFTEQHKHYKAAVQTARLHGFTYRDIADISANADVGELVDRMLALKNAQDRGREGDVVRHALTGTAPKPTILLSQAFDMFRARCSDRLVKNALDVRKWENPRRLAINNLILVTGDKSISDLTRKDIVAFQEWWLERIVEEELTAEGANKNFMHLSDILDTVFVASDIDPPFDLDTMFAKVRLTASDGSRKSFDAKYVQEVFLSGDALSGLNSESRALLYFMADTGARVAEIAGLSSEDIRLDTTIPFIHVRNNERRTLKTPQSDRQIPLVGSALHAAQLFPSGLSRFSSADSASTQVNKYIRHHGLNPTKEHSLYSLRHTFKDRLRDAQAPEELIDNLMGHKSRGPKYGRGHILETKLEWLEKIAFTIQSEVSD